MSGLIFITDKAHVAAAESDLQHFETVSALLAERFGFRSRYDKKGVFDFFYHEQFRENVLGYDGGELWAKNPSDEFLSKMIEIAQAFPQAKVMDSNGRQYFSAYDVRHDNALLEPKPQTLGKASRHTRCSLKIALVATALLVLMAVVLGFA